MERQTLVSRLETGSDSTASVDVRVVMFTVAGQTIWLCVDDTDALPRRIVDPFESLDVAARRTIQETAAVQPQYLEQLYTLSVSESGVWTIVASHMALLLTMSAPPQLIGSHWIPVEEAVSLSGIDRLVVDYAILRLRAKLSYTNIAFHLMPPEFTLSELQHIYETVLDQTLDKRNFRRRFATSGILATTGKMRREGSHRPAQLYRFRAEQDDRSYLTPDWTTVEEPRI